MPKLMSAEPPRSSSGNAAVVFAGFIAAKTQNPVRVYIPAAAELMSEKGPSNAAAIEPIPKVAPTNHTRRRLARRLLIAPAPFALVLNEAR